MPRGGLQRGLALDRLNAEIDLLHLHPRSVQGVTGAKDGAVVAGISWITLFD